MYNVYTSVDVYSDDPFGFSGSGIGSYNFPNSNKKWMIGKFENKDEAEAYIKKEMDELAKQLISEFGAESIEIRNHDIYVFPIYTFYTFWIVDENP